MAREGSILAGRYRLGDVIGRGGMSTVYRAEDLRLERTVAVKVMSAALAEQDPVSIARFEREARAAASLTHPGIATVYDTGIEEDTRYIVMELAPGQSLQAIIQAQAPLAPALAVDIAAQVADVLSVAHAAGIVHRDVKPGNVMVAPDGSVKVLDFGIARAAGGATLTQVRSVVGTVAFMSPEQATGAPTDARSDVYSLGCVIYAMLTAKPPFMAEVTAAVLHQHTSVAPRPLHEVAPNVPAALEVLVMQMLAKEPADRPQTAAEVRDRLRATLDPTAATIAVAPPPVLEPTQIAPTPPPPIVEPPPTRPAPPAGTPPRDSRSTRSGRWLAIAAVALLAAVIAVVAVAAAGSGGGSKSTSTPSTTSPARTTEPTSTQKPSSSTTTTPSTSTITTTTTSTTPSSTTTPSSSTSTTPSTSTTTPSTPGSGGVPPGHGGTPPGQAKKQG